MPLLISIYYRNSSKLEIIQSSSDGDLLQPKKNGLSTTTTKKYSTFLFV